MEPPWSIWWCLGLDLAGSCHSTDLLSRNESARVLTSPGPRGLLACAATTLGHIVAAPAAHTVNPVAGHRRPDILSPRRILMTHSDDPHHPAGATVVVGVDGSRGADVALRWAARFATQRHQGIQLVHGMNLAAVGAGGGYAVTIMPMTPTIQENGRAVIADAERIVREIAPDLPVTAELTADRASARLIERSADAYAVVLGATGSAGTLAHLGSTLLEVTAHARGPVIVVRTDSGRDDAVRATGPVVVGIDGSPTSEAAIAAAFTEATERRTDLVAVHTWNDQTFGRHARRDEPALAGADLEQAEKAILAERLAGWQEKYPDVTVHREIYPSDPTAQLQRWSESAQLIVVGSRGRGGFTGLLLGSTTNSLVQHAHCPVMVVHPARH
jgi:nucleotide-binding universal stress UspA family protein